MAKSNKAAKQRTVNEGLAYLIENVMEKSTVVMLVKDIRDKLTGIAEDIAGVEAKDIMPMLNSMVEAFGPEIADSFNQTATEQLRQLVTSVQACKTTIDQEIIRLEQGVEGGDMSDMAMDNQPPAPGAEPGLPTAPAAGPPAAGATGEPAPPPGPTSVSSPDVGGNAEDDALAGAQGGGFAGRPKKESAKPRGKTLKEFGELKAPLSAHKPYRGYGPDGPYRKDASKKLPGENLIRKIIGKKKPQKESAEVSEDFIEPRAPQAQPAIDQHPHKSEEFERNLGNIALFHGKAGELARNIAAMIDREPLSLDQRRGLANVLSHFGAYAHDASHWGNAETKLTAALEQADIYDIGTPAMRKIVGKLRELAHVISMKHKGVVESNITRLRDSANPDALIVTTFRRKLVESRDAQMAAINTARMFAIDVDDVIGVVRESFKKVSEAHIGFAKLKGELAHRKGVTNPGGLAKFIGDKKYGKAGMAKKAAAGRRHTDESATSIREFKLSRTPNAPGRGPSRGRGKGVNEEGGGVMTAQAQPGRQGGQSLLQNVPIFPVNANSNQSQQQQPAVGGPPQDTGNPSTRKPQTPDDMRMQRAQATSIQQGSQAAAGGTTNATVGTTTSTNDQYVNNDPTMVPPRNGQEPQQKNPSQLLSKQPGQQQQQQQQKQKQQYGKVVQR